MAAGSLLGVALHQGVSYPVGKVDLLNLYPLSFREYLCAVNEKALSDALLSKDFSLIDGFSEKYIYHLKNYYYVGGMPEVVKNFALHGDYNTEAKKPPSSRISSFKKRTRSFPSKLRPKQMSVPKALKPFTKKYKPEVSVRFSLLPYKRQDWMVNIPLYAVCLL